jgi:hypothetical protein
MSAHMPHPLGYYVFQAFKAAVNEPSSAYEEDHFFGAINSLLQQNFPLDTGFLVVPRPVPVGCNEQFVFAMDFDVRYKGKTVLIVLIQPRISLPSASMRKDADTRMRSRFSNAYKDCPVEVLHGVIFFGTRFARYKIERDTGNWAPPRPMGRVDSKIDLQPAEELWRNDILEPGDAEVVLELFGAILRACRAVDED